MFGQDRHPHPEPAGVRLLLGGAGVADDDVLAVAAWASRAENNDPIDRAVLGAAGSAAEVTVESFTPFDPVNKRTEAEVRNASGERFRVSKGAPQVIAALCHRDGVDDEDGAAARVDEVVNGFADHGYRSLGSPEPMGRAPGD